MKRLLFLLVFLPTLIFGQIKISEMLWLSAPDDSTRFVVVWDSSGTKVSRQFVWDRLREALPDDVTLEISGGEMIIKAGGVSTAKIADLAVTNAKIATDAVAAGNIADGGVDNTATLADSIVSKPKLTEALIQFIGAGGAIENSPDELTIDLRIVGVDTTLMVMEAMIDTVGMGDDFPFVYGNSLDIQTKFNSTTGNLQTSGGDHSYSGNYLVNTQNLPDIAAGAEKTGYWFDGVDDDITVSDDADLDFGTGDFSILTTCKIYDGDGANTPIVAKHFALNNRANAPAYSVQWATDNKLYLYIGATGFVRTAAITGRNDGIKYLATVRSSTPKVYINSEDVTDDNSGPTVDVDNAINLHFAGDANNTAFGNLEMYSTYIFNLALTAAEVKEYQNGPVPYKYLGASQTELMPNQVDRDFSGASAWANVDINAYDETGDLTITATAAAQYCTCPVASAPTTIGKRYRMTYDLANIVETWTVKSFDGTQTIGTISANGTQAQLEWTATTTGGYRIVSVATTSSGDFDNFTLTQIGCVAQYEPQNITSTTWFDASGNKLDGTVSGAVVTNPREWLFVDQTDPSANRKLVSINKTVSGSQTELFSIDEDGDVVIDGGDDANTLTVTSTYTAYPQVHLTTTGDNGIGPSIQFELDQDNPADDQIISIIQAEADNSGNSNQIYVTEWTRAEDITTGDEAGSYDLKISIDSDLKSFIKADGYNGSVNEGTITLNDDSEDVDFLVESDNLTNGIFMRGSDGDVDLGGSSPTGDFQVTRGAANSYIDAGDAAWTGTSDKSLKENIREMPSLLEKLDDFEGPKIWNFKKEKMIVEFPTKEYTDKLNRRKVIESMSDEQKKNNGAWVVIDSVAKYKTKTRWVQESDTVFVPVVDTVDVKWKYVKEYQITESEFDKLKGDMLDEMSVDWYRNQVSIANEVSAKTRYGPMAQDFNGTFFDDPSRKVLEGGKVEAVQWKLIMELYEEIKALKVRVTALENN